MSEQFYNLIRNCSKNSKSNISNFLCQLLNNDQNQIATEESESQNNQYLKLQQIFKRISSKFSIQRSREISKDERSKKMLTNHQYNYGEITFKTIFQIMKKLRQIKRNPQNEIFYDLGSGSGKVIFGAGLCYPFSKCKGIQFLESLYQQSIRLKQKILSQKQQIEKQINQFIEDFDQYHLPQIQISNGDFKSENWCDATVVYVSSTCYSRQVMNQISTMSQNLRKGTILISLTKSIQNLNWKIVQKFQGQTSWGTCTIFLHQKLTDIYLKGYQQKSI